MEHVIKGIVRDAQGDPVKEAVIFICDRDSGMEIDETTKEPLPWVSTDRTSEAPIKRWTTRTDGEGRFEFRGLKEGAYRLIAQSWPDVKVVDDPMAVNGYNVILRGIAEDVQVPAEDGQFIEIIPLGDANFTYVRGSGNNETFFVLSTGRPTADAILGPLGLRGPFQQNVIVFGRMSYGKIIARGLPEGLITYWLFVADNVPGFAFGEFQAKAGQVATSRMNLVAGWSDGRHDPPVHLVALCDELREMSEKEGRDSLYKLLIAGREKEWEARPKGGRMFDSVFITADVLGPLEREIEMPSGTNATVADIMAAKGYLQMEWMQERRKARAAQND